MLTLKPEVDAVDSVQDALPANAATTDPWDTLDGHEDTADHLDPDSDSDSDPAPTPLPGPRHSAVRVTVPTLALPHLLLAATTAAVVAATAHQVVEFVAHGPVMPTTAIAAADPGPAECVMFCDPPPPPPPGDCVVCDPVSPGPTRAAEVIEALLRAARR
ncbi:hypothetical protein [Nocardia paucivorans]|uniref:hypothetical protein n=1 Tax=Nocardia paucivorans TaxID=114259 RepID=UPI0002E33086|nr:hypothetical protein [Nocardia paucivorans]